MTLEELYYISQIVAVVAIFASLIFVGIQLRQNTRAVHVSTAQAHFTMWHSLVTPLTENADMAKIWWQGLSDFDGLIEQDRMRFIVYAGNVFRFYESSRIQWRRGQLDSELWHAVEVNIREFASQPGVQKFWNIRKNWHSIEFINWFESLQSQVPSALYGPREPVGSKIAMPDSTTPEERK